MGSNEIYYSRGALTAQQVRQEIDAFWEDQNTGQGFSDDELSRIRAGLAETHDLEQSHAITISVDSSGSDPSAVLLVVAFAPTANRILKDMWSTVILPRIKRRRGEDAIGPKANHHDQ